MSNYLTWLADDLRAVGIKVVEMPGYRTRGHGDFSTTQISVVWHHDASPVGDSPYSAQAQVNRWDGGDGVSGNCEVDRYGTWFLIGAGVAWHAGNVLPGMPGNYQSYGVETDHTTGEDWPEAQLRSMRLGTRVILRRTGGRLHFHKSICSPVGRQPDPDGLDLNNERVNVDNGRNITIIDAPGLPDLGTVGAGIKATQERLLALGYSLPSGADGVYGMETLAAIKALQKAAGIAVDGIIGPDTQFALDKGVRASGAAPAPAPAPAPASTLLDIDGALGPNTIKRWQQVMGTPVDGVISSPSELVRAVQRRIGSDADGYMGPNTIRRLQMYLGTAVDGVISTPRSSMVVALQYRLNAGSF